MAILEGKKTYVAAVITIVTAVGAYLTGEAQLADVIAVIVPAVLVFLMRKGTADETKQIIAEVTQVKTEAAANTVSAVQEAIRREEPIETTTDTTSVVDADQLRSITGQPKTVRKR